MIPLFSFFFHVVLGRIACAEFWDILILFDVSHGENANSGRPGRRIARYRNENRPKIQRNVSRRGNRHDQTRHFRGRLELATSRWKDCYEDNFDSNQITKIERAGSKSFKANTWSTQATTRSSSRSGNKAGKLTCTILSTASWCSEDLYISGIWAIRSARLLDFQFWADRQEQKGIDL